MYLRKWKVGCDSGRFGLDRKLSDLNLETSFFIIKIPDHSPRWLASDMLPSISPWF